MSVPRLLQNNMKKLTGTTQNLTERNIEKIAELFPGAVSEVAGEGGVPTRAVDFDLLRQALSGALAEGTDERYRLDWPGKKASLLKANTPITKTLRPDYSSSVDFDTTQNVFIEGDNFEALKVLQESYLGKVKMIYTDPPYNTGKDFVYRDNFTKDKAEYEEEIEAVDEEGNKMFRENTRTNPRFHSDWLSMMYERLLIARDLLRDDGVIFISIDDNEVNNLRKVCDEVFGETNSIAQMVWAAGRKNDSRYISVSHEYILVYVKDESYLSDKKTLWRERKNGLDAIYGQHEKLKIEFGDNYKKIEEKLSEWYQSLKPNHPARSHKHYNKVDERGVYFPADVSWPGGGGPTYEVLHPVTRKPCAVPSRGWMFSKPEKMQEAIKENRVHFGYDETYVPCIKSYLVDRESQVPYSVFYQDGRAATKRLRELMGGNYFENPKDESILEALIEYVSYNNPEGVYMDFFSGSATTAHAVMAQNAEDGGNRKFIMVQLPEETPEGSEARKAGYKTIAEIGRERIRRAAPKIKTDYADKLAERETPLDTGFRAYRVADTVFKDVERHPAELEQGRLLELADNIKDDRTPSDLLTQVMLELGLTLDLPIKEKKVGSNTVFFVADNALVACFDKEVPLSIIDEIAQGEPLQVVFRDASFGSDDDLINAETHLKRLSPDTILSVL